MTKPEDPARELPRKIAKRQETIERHTAQASAYPGADPVSRACRAYHDGIARHTTEKAELEEQLRQITG